MKEGINSSKERSLGLNAKKVAVLKSVKMRIKIINRLITQRMVFGIFKRTSMDGV